MEDISHTSWLLWWFEVLSLLTLLVVFRRVLDTLRQHFLTMTIQATSRSSQHVSKLAPINRLNVPPTSHSKSMVPYPTSSLMYSNSRFWKNTTETFSDSTPDLFSDTKHHPGLELELSGKKFRFFPNRVLKKEKKCEMSFMYTHSSDSRDLRKKRNFSPGRGQNVSKLGSFWSYISVLPYHVEETPGKFFPADF